MLNYAYFLFFVCFLNFFLVFCFVVFEFSRILLFFVSIKLKLLIREAIRIIVRLGGTTPEEKGSKLSKKFHSVLEEFRKEVTKNPEKAFELYEKLERIYNNLKNKEKEHAYLQLSAAYSRLKNSLRR